MTRIRLLCLVLLAVFTVTGTVADEIHLSDGRVIEGEIISAAEAEIIDIRVTSGGLVAVQHVPRAKVARVVYRVSARQGAVEALQRQIDALAQRSDASAGDWWVLARRLQDRGETASARELAQRVVALDRHHPEARRLLGMALYRGVWMRPNEAATARGEVFFRGAWMSWTQQEQVLADEARRREELALARKERDEQREQRRLARAAAAEASAALQETYVGGYYRSPYYNPFGGWYYQGRYPVNPLHPGGVLPPHCRTGGIGWSIGAAGGGSNSAWGFRWNGFTSAGSSSYRSW
jgi:tetratricopeptide (TPR) repeat protein